MAVSGLCPRGSHALIHPHDCFLSCFMSVYNLVYNFTSQNQMQRALNEHLMWQLLVRVDESGPSSPGTGFRLTEFNCTDVCCGNWLLLNMEQNVALIWCSLNKYSSLHVYVYPLALSSPNVDVNHLNGSVGPLLCSVFCVRGYTLHVIRCRRAACACACRTLECLDTLSRQVWVMSTRRMWRLRACVCVVHCLLPAVQHDHYSHTQSYPPSLFETLSM